MAQLTTSQPPSLHAPIDAQQFDDPRHLAQVFEHSPIGIAVVGMNDRFVKANPQFCRLLGYTEAELRERTFIDITYPEDSHECIRHVEALVTGEISVLRLEKRYLHKDGHIVWAMAAATLVRSESGEPQYVIAQVVDLTSRHAIESQLRESQARYRSLVEDQTDIICRFKPDCTLTYVNQAYCDERHMMREELLGRRFTDFLLPGRLATVQEYIHDLLADPRIMREEVRIVDQEGAVRWYQWVDHPIFGDDGNVVEIQAVGRDITDRKLVELELERHATLEGLLRKELDHRVRNNLTSLLSLVDITRGAADDIDGFTMALSGRIKAMAAVHGLLSQTRTSAIRLVQLIVSLLPAEKHGQVTIAGPDIRLASRQVSAMGMVIHELLTNACKYGPLALPSGHVHVTWSIAPVQDESKRRVTLDWHEQGGRAPEVRPGGAGLGLIRGLTQSELAGHVTINFTPQGAQHHFEFILDAPVTAEAIAQGAERSAVVPPVGDDSEQVIKVDI